MWGIEKVSSKRDEKQQLNKFCFDLFIVKIPAKLYFIIKKKNNRNSIIKIFIFLFVRYKTIFITLSCKNKQIMNKIKNKKEWKIFQALGARN